jgi:nicotinate-nucleotide adenylyltransferase
VDALFGGSFDPVHMGHLIVAEAVADALNVCIRFVVAREQPFKGRTHGASPEQRAEMLAAAVAGNPRFTVERIELELPTPSYTVRTLRALAEREPGNRFLLLVGGDAVRDLPKWHEVHALPDLADVVGLSRPGFPVPAGGLIARTLTVPIIDISATAVRERVARGRSIRYLVPEAVRDYIAAHGLYR